MQPLTFEPLLVSTIWGGDKIIPFKQLHTDQKQVGESWEISGVEGSETVVAEGPYKGRHLNELVKELKDQLVGHDNYRRFGDEFPLLIKFIDAQRDLSIQVHPSDEIARRQGKHRGKTEMWYIMKSDPKAHLHAGLKKAITPEQYKQMVADDTIVDAIADYEVHEGDCFFLPAGRIHSIGAGCFLAEIQQTSDVTYRIYDFKRKDANGHYRELHTDLAAECIDYRVQPDYRTEYVPMKNEGVSLVHCDYFHTAVYDLNEPMLLDYSELDSFVILVTLEGEGKAVDNEGNETPLRAGSTLLVPASTQTLQITGTVKFLETYV